MAETDPKIQSRLIRDLEPAVAIEIERHIRTTREWYPHGTYSCGYHSRVVRM